MPPSASLSCNVDRISGFSGVILLFCGASLRGRSDGAFVSGFETRDVRWCVVCGSPRFFGVFLASAILALVTNLTASIREGHRSLGLTRNNGPVSYFLILVLCFYLISSERAFLFCYHTHHTHLGE